MEERLQKLIAAAGIASRRHAEELIKAGKVAVNGAVVTELGTKANPETDHIKVNGRLINRLLDRTLLVPDIEAILSGRHSKGMMLEELTRATPSAWEDPAKVLGWVISDRGSRPCCNDRERLRYHSGCTTPLRSMDHSGG